MINQTDDFKSEVMLLPWNDQVIEDQHFILKWSNRDSSYTLMASDFHNMWHESLNQMEIEERNNELNPNIEAPVQAILSHLSSFSCERTNNANSKIIALDQDNLQIQYEAKLGGIPFVWKFFLGQVRKEVFVKELTLPLIAMVSEQQRRITELYQLLHNKDTELEDYQLSGAKVSHKRLETKPFDESAFLQESSLSEEMKMCVKEAEKRSFKLSIQNLYTDVVKCLNKHTENDSSAVKEELISKKIEEVVPMDLEAEDKQSHKISKKLKESDRELERRQELTKQLLDKEKEKGSRKKKKIFKL